MSRIKGKDTKAEMMFRKELFRKGYRYSLNHRFKELNFKPDIVMVSNRTCIFVDGCFWHGCKRCYKKPKSNKAYWSKKIRENMLRDTRQNKYLKQKNWKVIRIWEHEIVNNLDKVMDKVIRNIRIR